MRMIGRGIGLRTMEEQVVEPVEPGNGNWQLLAAVGSWQLDVDIACHVCDTHFSLPSSVSWGASSGQTSQSCFVVVLPPPSSSIFHFFTFRLPYRFLSCFIFFFVFFFGFWRATCKLQGGRTESIGCLLGAVSLSEGLLPLSTWRIPCRICRLSGHIQAKLSNYLDEHNGRGQQILEQLILQSKRYYCYYLDSK